MSWLDRAYRRIRIGIVVAEIVHNFNDGSAMQIESAKKITPDVLNSAEEKLAAKKSAVRALKRVLIAKAEMRRLRALTQAKSVGSRR
jgi:hypothetical protein